MSKQANLPTISDQLRHVASRHFPDKVTPYGEAIHGTNLLLNAAADRLETQWQPIETAPKDGTVVLGYGITDGEVSGPSSEKTIEPMRHLGPSGEWGITGGDYYIVWIRPTHWMPLPEPPEDENG